MTDTPITRPPRAARLSDVRVVALVGRQAVPLRLMEVWAAVDRDIDDAEGGEESDTLREYEPAEEWLEWSGGGVAKGAALLIEYRYGRKSWAEWLERRLRKLGYLSIRLKRVRTLGDPAA